MFFSNTEESLLPICYSLGEPDSLLSSTPLGDRHPGKDLRNCVALERARARHECSTPIGHFETFKLKTTTVLQEEDGQ